MNILVIHGPNLHFLGKRKPEIYGTQTLAEINSAIKDEADRLGIAIRTFQSNSEGGIIDILTENAEWADALVINPAAYTHTSIAILDALKSVNIPTVEVHISKVDKREDFRQTSYIRSIAVDTVSGKGLQGYLIAIDILNKG